MDYNKNAVTFLIAMVWLINGLFCKILNLVPRHRQIVASILGGLHAAMFTIAIGVAETAMAVWILTRIQHRLNAITQIIVIAVMNAMEFFLVPQLLLWGKLNAFFALLFMLVIYYNEFILTKKAV